MSTKKSLTEIRSVKDEFYMIRGATLIHESPRALSRIPSYPRQITSACNVAEYSTLKCVFDCALSGPFDNLFLA